MWDLINKQTQIKYQINSCTKQKCFYILYTNMISYQQFICDCYPSNLIIQFPNRFCILILFTTQIKSNGFAN